MDDKKVTDLLNKQAVGKDGVAIYLSGNNEKKPKYLGEFIVAEHKGPNIVFRFTKHSVHFFAPMAMLSVIKEEKEDKFALAEICDDMFIGEESLEEIIKRLLR